MTNLFTEIESVHATLTGWCSWEKAQTLVSIVLATRPKISIEVGIWAGKSVIPIALAHKHLGGGIVLAIDPWMADASIEGQLNPADYDWWKDQASHDSIYKEFMRRIHELGLQNCIDVIRKKSDEFEPPDGVGFLHLDGNHGVQSIRDVERYAPKIKLGGFLVADDLHWTGGAVERAIELLPNMGFIEAYRVENEKESWAVFQRVKV